MTRKFTDQHIENMSRSQQNRKLNHNNRLGHKNITLLKTGKYRVRVIDTHIGHRDTLEEAIKLRDEARKRMMEYVR